jgi:hypothetical protein
MPTLTASYLPVSAQRIAWMETMLREDESSTDELLETFFRAHGVPAEVAQSYIARRADYLNEKAAKLPTGPHFDYVNQAWTVNGRYVVCEHPVNCKCYGTRHAGELAPIENLPTAND